MNKKLITTKLILSVLASCNLLDKYSVAAENNRFQNEFWNPVNRQDYSISEYTQNDTTTEIEGIKSEKVNLLPTNIFGDYSNYPIIEYQSDINKDTFSKTFVIRKEITTTRLYSLCYQYPKYTFVYAGNLKLPRCSGNQLKVFTDTYFIESDIKLDQKTMEEVFVEASLILLKKIKNCVFDNATLSFNTPYNRANHSICFSFNGETLYYAVNNDQNADMPIETQMKAFM